MGAHISLYQFLILGIEAQNENDAEALLVFPTKPLVNYKGILLYDVISHRKFLSIFVHVIFRGQCSSLVANITIL